MSQRVLVCGGRDFADREFLFHVLDQFHAMEPFSVVIHGAARGADTLAKKWAIDRHIRHLPFPADWIKYGNAAGPIRNSQMLRDGQPELVIAFPGKTGTADMVQKAIRANIKVVEISSTRREAAQ